VKVRVNGRPDSGPAQLGAALAELASRRRLAASADCGAGNPPWSNRLAAAARCWDRVGVETARDEFGRLAIGLADLGAALAASPDAAPDLLVRLHRLDAGLTSLLLRYDAACAPDVLVADVSWATLAAAVRGENPGPVRPDEAGRPTEAAGPVALLVTSPFLRDVLCARLADAGCRVLHLDEPGDAPALLQAADPPCCLLCDNEEPTNNLRRLRGLLGPEPFLVLVGAADGAEDENRRARALGADATWPEPWASERLPRCRSARGTS
jgi:hypothetical protein